MSNPQAQPVEVVADDREAACPVPESLRQVAGVEVVFRRLAVGDYVVDRRCVFERKTMLDFATSIVDGRLFIQAQRLAALREPAVIILEGTGADLAAIRMRRESLQGAFISLALIFHLPVLRSLDGAETARLMLYAAGQVRRHEWDCGTYYGRRPKRKRRIQLRILQGLPGVGPSRALQLLEAFGSVEAVMTASAAKLEELDGFGPKTAQAIRDVLHEAPISSRSQSSC